MFKKLRASFITGALIVIPILLTFWVLYFVIDRFNLLLLQPIMSIFHNWVPAQSTEVLAKIAILVFLMLLLTFIGFAARIIVLRNIFGFGEKILYRVPMISTVYRTIKEISFAFLVQKDTIFKKVVLIEYPRKGLYQLGFIVSITKGEAHKKIGASLVNVFVPTTPNPTSGMMVIVPEDDVISLDMSVAEGMKFVISGGAFVPKKNN